jgi:hypothetical protein
MVKAKKASRRTAVKNLKPRRVKGSLSRHVKGGFSKINPIDGGTSGGGLNDKMN